MHIYFSKEDGIFACFSMNTYKLGIDIGFTTVKVAILDNDKNLIFSDYERHFANIQETLQLLLEKAVGVLGDFDVNPVITGSGGLTLAKYLEIAFTQEVVAVSAALSAEAPFNVTLPLNLVVKMQKLYISQMVLTRE